ncbi:DUF2117 domain-containing protein [Methanocella paludicola]|uniref:DUF2117 domain-containing protein n=1 Tax=Methanocella paludicola TaxID=570267 RepID=UPI001E60D188|nr:DUF2117 domain-containing protein [Methanocella paludicola]
MHGPEAVYSGEVSKVISFLESRGDVRAFAAGTMCRTAIIDMRLENVIDITVCDLPSRTLSAIPCAVPIMVNNGKSVESGLAFGDIVAGRTKRTAIQVERASEKDGVIVLWEVEPNETASWVARALSEHFAVPLRQLWPSVNSEGECHAVRCACPGEPLFVNGVLIGVVESPEVKAYIRDGRIVRLEGVSAKDTGLARLGQLKEAKFKSGYIRYKAGPACDVPVRYGKGRMAVIDHIAFSSLERIDPDTVCALTVGDDTTEVAGDVLARRGVRVIGITDGDRDGVLKGPARASGSVILRILSTTDDEAGAALARKINGTDTFEGFVAKVREELARMGVEYEVAP